MDDMGGVRGRTPICELDGDVEQLATGSGACTGSPSM